ncbi:hypothetical protein [Zunongwangia sp. H14]|uniref:hypothetical protein n=1 Tax=Zunongwangia sp. H14 TaxID=3240792 RepID=UPI0035657C08
MRKIQLIVFLIFTTNFVLGQNKILFHQYSPTASSWDIVKWNLKDTTGVNFILKEIVDKQGRVKELDFLEKGKLIKDPLCYLANKVTYKYKNNEIIETLYQNDHPILATDCEMNYKRIYHLDKEKNIDKIEYFSKYDFSQIDSTEIKQWKEWVPEYKVVTPDSTQLEIEYYYHSFSKMNGAYPVSKNYKFIDDYYYGDQPEKESVLKGLQKN